MYILKALTNDLLPIRAAFQSVVHWRLNHSEELDGDSATKLSDGVLSDRRVGGNGFAHAIGSKLHWFIESNLSLRWIEFLHQRLKSLIAAQWIKMRIGFD